MEQTPKPIEPDGMFEGLNLRAVIAGTLADIASTFILGMIITTVLLVKLHGADIPEDAVEKILESDSNLYIYLLLGLCCTMFGGFMGARIAGSFPIRHGGWIGAASLIAGVIIEMMLGQDQTYPDWYMYISMAGVIPAGVLGGYIYLILHNTGKSN